MDTYVYVLNVSSVSGGLWLCQRRARTYSGRVIFIIIIFFYPSVFGEFHTHTRVPSPKHRKYRVSVHGACVKPYWVLAEKTPRRTNTRVHVCTNARTTVSSYGINRLRGGSLNFTSIFRRPVPGKRDVALTHSTARTTGLEFVRFRLRKTDVQEQRAKRLVIEFYDTFMRLYWNSTTGSNNDRTANVRQELKL